MARRTKRAKRTKRTKRTKKRQRGKGIPGASLAVSVLVDAAKKAAQANWRQTKKGEFEKAYERVPNPKRNKWSWLTGVGIDTYRRRKGAKKNNYDRDYGYGKW